MLAPRTPHWRLLSAASITTAFVALVGACNLDRPTDTSGATGGAEEPISGPSTSTSSAESDAEFAYEARVLQRMPELENVAELPTLRSGLYPPALKDARIGGVVVFRFVVEPDGTVDPQSVKLVSASHRGFVEVTEQVIRAFRFRPGQYQERDVRVLVEMPVTWSPGS